MTSLTSVASNLVMNPVNSSEQLRELSSNDLNFLENNPIEIEPSPDEDQDGDSNNTVRDLENILNKFEADTQLLLDNPDQLLNCKYLPGFLGHPPIGLICCYFRCALVARRILARNEI